MEPWTSSESKRSFFLMESLMSPQLTRCFEDVFLFEPNTVLCLWEGKDKESEKTMNIYGILLEKNKTI